MEEREKGQEPRVSVPVEPKMGLFLGIIVGLLLLVIGSATTNDTVIRVGAFILSLASFWGGLYLPREHAAIKTALVAIGGLVAIAAFASCLGVSSFLM